MYLRFLLLQQTTTPSGFFKLPEGHYAQESRFVPRRNGISEDDGWLLSYVFNESQLDEEGNATPAAKSELWIIEARSMSEVICKIKLPSRVPYGLHGCFFSEQDIRDQRPVEAIRKHPVLTGKCGKGILSTERTWLHIAASVRSWILGVLR